ncbi:MAG: NAD(P)-dependent oxidoreductase [Bacteroidota bacterium]
MKMLITGASGFTGAHLIRHFARQGHEIIALGRQKAAPGQLLKYARYLSADIRQEIPTQQVDVVIHTAALTSDQAPFEELYQTNVEGTRHVFEACREASLFIYLSSSSVYPFSEQPLTESDVDLARTTSAYGRSKYLAEQYLLEQSDQSPLLILRPRAIYGSQDRVLLPRILRMVRSGRIISPGRMDIEVSMTHIDNLIRAIERGMLSDIDSPCILNIADEQTYQLREVIQSLVEGIHQRPLPIRSLSPHLLLGLSKLLAIFGRASQLSQQAIDYLTQPLVLNVAKAQQTIGYRAVTSFEEERSKIVDWVHDIGLETVLKKPQKLSWKL